MKKTLLIFFIFSLLLIPVFEAAGQDIPNVFDMSNFPQWGKDLRRVDIIMFGVFPFSMFIITTITDSVRWYHAGDAPFTDNRYAPWPIKSAGAIEMTTDEHFRTIMLAAGLSVTISLVDLLIVKLKQNKERRRIESRPSSIYNIDRIPIKSEIIEEEADISETGEEDETKTGVE